MKQKGKRGRKEGRRNAAKYSFSCDRIESSIFSSVYLPTIHRCNQSIILIT
jgi:hypothetical protein